MRCKYILDTNAFFNFIKYVSLPQNEREELLDDNINKIKNADCYISLISTVEIISVIGKYARGGAGASTRMKPKVVKKWIKLVEDIISGQSPILKISTLSFSEEIIVEAQNIIHYALIHNFGSLDAMIAATAKHHFGRQKYENMSLITSDKGLKACLNKCGIPYWDVFKDC